MFWPFGRHRPWRHSLLDCWCSFNIAWGLTMAALTTNLRLQTYGIELSKCFLYAFILRSSACTINDIFDRKVDAGVGEYLSFLCTKYSSSWCHRTDSKSARGKRTHISPRCLPVSVYAIRDWCSISTFYRSWTRVSQTSFWRRFLMTVALIRFWVALFQLLPL